MTPLYGLAAELASSQTRRGMMVRANKSSSNLTNARRDNEEELRKRSPEPVKGGHRDNQGWWRWRRWWRGGEEDQAEHQEDHHTLREIDHN